MTSQVWLITGSSSGFGRHLVEHALSKGDKVVATLRKPEVLSELQGQYSSNQLLLLKLDVTKPEEIADAFAKAQEVFGRIDVVFNNAGYGVLAEVEGTSEEAARAMFETNFWGATNVMREAVKYFRNTNQPSGGRLLNVSSLCGTVGHPMLGFYSATKFALEGLTETLALELDPDWNIKITLLELGFYQTECLNNAVNEVPHPAYKKDTLPTIVARNYFATPGVRFPGNPVKGMAKVYDLAHSDEAPLRLALGRDSLSSQRTKLMQTAENLDQYESWSEDLSWDD